MILRLMIRVPVAVVIVVGVVMTGVVSVVVTIVVAVAGAAAGRFGRSAASDKERGHCQGRKKSETKTCSTHYQLLQVGNNKPSCDVVPGRKLRARDWFRTSRVRRMTFLRELHEFDLGPRALGDTSSRCQTKLPKQRRTNQEL